VAWHPLGWEPFAFAEIEKFPSAVLAHHYPSVPNLGDMTKFKDWPDAAIDVLVGGTPCQSFSVAGLRKGMADPRGNLALTYLAIADRYKPNWLLWENVPGVLSSSEGRDFGAFLGGLAELGYGFAYGVRDAQYVRVDGFARAVPQRRRRVFVVGYLGDWRRAAAVLFERESLLWDSAPRRQAGERASVAVAPCLRAGGNDTGGDRPYGTDVDTCDSLIAFAHQQGGSADLHMGRDIALALQKSQEQAICFSAKDHGGDAEVGLAPTLRAGGFTGSHANAGVMPAIAYGLRRDADRSGEAVTPSLDAQGRLRLRDAGFNAYEELAPTLDTVGPHTVATSWAVRRLTPQECERLQGFPDGYTAIPKAADGPRYKALGNSMAVNVMRWLGTRIEMVNSLTHMDAVGQAK
jgi:DNA (cytosine-5)-methyltransferase 1